MKGCVNPGFNFNCSNTPPLFTTNHNFHNKAISKFDLLLESCGERQHYVCVKYGILFGLKVDSIKFYATARNWSTATWSPDTCLENEDREGEEQSVMFEKRWFGIGMGIIFSTFDLIISVWHYFTNVTHRAVWQLKFLEKKSDARGECVGEIKGEIICRAAGH